MTLSSGRRLGPYESSLRLAREEWEKSIRRGTSVSTVTSRPQVLLLDEPSLGLAPILVHTIFESIEEIHRQGTPVLLVEQNANAALKHSNRAYVLETGTVALEGTSAQVAANPKVKEAYLGE